MTIQSERVDRNSVVLFLSGRLDTFATSELELALNQLVDGSTDITLDLKDLSYISSLGLHVLLQTLKVMSASKRKFVIRNVGEAVRAVLEMTGFTSLITLEESKTP